MKDGLNLDPPSFNFTERSWKLGVTGKSLNITYSLSLQHLPRALHDGIGRMKDWVNLDDLSFNFTERSLK